MEFRTFTPELELRSASKRLLRGIVVPFGVNQQIDGTLTERFESGAFKHQLKAASRVKLYSEHSIHPRSVQLGHATELREDQAGLFGEFYVVPSRDGDHYLELVKAGSLSEWSIGFRTMAYRMDGRITVRTKATVFETALVPEGAYGELASVGEVRAAVPRLTRDTLLARLPEPHFPA